MSWDVAIGGDEPCPHCGRTSEPFNTNYTTNLAGALYDAGVNFRELNGRPGSEVAQVLTRAIAWMRRWFGTMSLLHNPDNGWGDMYGFCEWLDEIVRACEERPNEQFSVH